LRLGSQWLHSCLQLFTEQIFNHVRSSESLINFVILEHIKVKSLPLIPKAVCLRRIVGLINNNILLMSVEVVVKLNSLNYNPTVLSESFVITLVLLPSLLQNCLLSVCYNTSLLNYNKEDSNRQYEFSLQDEGAVQNRNNLMQHIITNKIIQQGNYHHANLHWRCRCVECYDFGKYDINV